MSVNTQIQHGPFYGFFYKVKDADDHTRGYVLGSFHVLLQTYELKIQWQEKVQRCFDKSQALVVEYDLLSHILTKIEEKSVKPTISKIRSTIESKRLMDMEILCRAYERSIPIHELETLEKQTQNVEAYQEETFKNSMAGYPISPYQTFQQELLEAISTSNEDLTKRLADDRLSPEFSKRFYDERNMGMAEKIDSLIREEPRRFFIVLGAGHVIGKQGIPSLLVSKGWTIKKYTA